MPNRWNSARSNLCTEQVPTARTSRFPTGRSNSMTLTQSFVRQLLADIRQLAADRAAAELRRDAEYAQRGDALAAEFREAQQSITKQYQTDKEAAEREYESIRRRTAAEYESVTANARAKLAQAEKRLAEQLAAAEQKTKKDFEDAQWEANAVFDATRDGPKKTLEHTESQIAALVGRIDQCVAEARNYAATCRLLGAFDRGFATTDEFSPAPDASVSDLPSQLTSAASTAGEIQLRLRSHWLSKLFLGPRLLGIWLVAIVGAVAAAGSLSGWDRGNLLLGAGALSAAGCAALSLWLYGRARRSMKSFASSLALARAQGLSAAGRLSERAQKVAEQEARVILQQRDRDLAAAKAKFDRLSSSIISRSNAELQSVQREAEQSLAAATQKRDQALAAAETKYPPLLTEIQDAFRTGLEQARQRRDDGTRQNEERRAAAWSELTEAWQTGMRRAANAVKELQAGSESVFPDWNSPVWDEWTPPAAAPTALQFGRLAIDLAEVPGGISSNPSLNEGIDPKYEIPALLDFPRASSLLIQAAGEGRERAINVVQSIMLRMLTSIPPGKVRFTIMDPVGLGENFSGFMHLADYDDILVTNRIWTETGQIEQRLADLTEQMENVIQKYLRNDYKTIEEYNAQAGEVAEAFRVLVVANFPTNFSEAAARRLTSIVSSGARCGVYTLLVVDANQPLPPGCDLNDLAPYCACLLERDGAYVWRDPDFRPYPLALERAPDEARFAQLVHLVGEAAKDSRRVEVPFEHIAPPKQNYWQATTKSGIDVPLGRAGATKLQALKLGRGTSQHVLVAGKTGSGKSTLLHALVTNLALTYSPDEIELYLIDFKKGVEFKTYATHELPHARVIAIESEREFGLSVLERLDAELRERGDRFREAGVQDLAGFRQEVPEVPLPRIMLIVDEFQELFTEDDKIAQDSALLLDRLVRQGRAFGIHVLLGSQTLGGAYSLARSTIGQMAVRIALQCSENDAHLILSEENSAARLLSRPGEAIYNDANGLVEGNNPFQVVWLADQRREQYLEEIKSLAANRPPRRNVRRIVFEGNAPADIRKNERLESFLSELNGVPHAAGEGESDLSLPADPTGAKEERERTAVAGTLDRETGETTPAPLAARPVRAWLGEAIAIKDPTAAVFRRENGRNLLIVGQRDDLAASIMVSSLISVAAQRGASPSNGAPNDPRFYWLDAPRAEARSSFSPAELEHVLGDDLRIVGRRELPAILEHLAAELERRQSDDGGTLPSLYLFVYDLGRFRDLRRDESDMGFSFSAEPQKGGPDKHFAAIYRDGPAVGIHVIVWCDTLSNLTRSIDRQGLREFDMHVLFQMSPNDSSHLIDSPAAGKLGPQLAIFQDEEAGVLEKFRPYAAPDADWLDWVAKRLGQRHDARPKTDPSADRVRTEQQPADERLRAGASDAV